MGAMGTLLLLLVGLPPSPSSVRVRVWRRLRSLGAVPLKRSAYLLPDTPERYEDSQWLAQEIQREGGDATLIRIQQIENVGQDDVLRLPAARYAGAVRGLSVARPGDPAGGGRRDADPDPADRERRPGRRAPPTCCPIRRSGTRTFSGSPRRSSGRGATRR